MHKKTPSNPKGAGRPKTDTSELKVRVDNRLYKDFSKRELRTLISWFTNKLLF